MMCVGCSDKSKYDGRAGMCLKRTLRDEITYAQDSARQVAEEVRYSKQDAVKDVKMKSE